MQPVKIVAYTDVGLRRKVNEDAFVVIELQNFVIIADGMGGGPAGKVAADILTGTFLEILADMPPLNGEQMVQAMKKGFAAGHENILHHIKKNPFDKGMGCAAVSFHIQDDFFVAAHVGDCRLYRLRGNDFKRVTTDHSFVQALVDEGVVSMEEAQNHPRKNVITRAVGIDDALQIDILKGDTLPGDQFLLCSDGLSDMLDDATIKRMLLNGGGENDTVCEQLIEAANGAGGKDNISVALVR